MRSAFHERPSRHPALRDFLLLTLFLVLTFFKAPEAKAQSAIELENVSASYSFGEQITFVATIKPSVTIQSVSIIISDELQGLTYTEPLKLPSDGRTEFRFDTRQNALRPFTHLRWNYQFTLLDGSTVQSQSFFVRYADNRFNWQTLESGTLRLNWYHGDASFGQVALEAAQSGLGSINRLMTLDPAQPIEIFVYANTADLRDTLVLGGEDWVAGHADPALGVVMVVIEPGAEQGIQMEQRIPHELMHVILFRSVGRGYQNIPAWLREGTATFAEIYPNADYERILTDAVRNDALIPLKDLCVSFPSEVGDAFLAYAESRSFTSYVHNTYGSAGLLRLVSSYADGVDCEHGPERALGKSLSALELNWRSSVLGQNAFGSTLQNISPYLVLLCLVLIIPFIGIINLVRKRGSSDESGRRE